MIPIKPSGAVKQPLRDSHFQLWIKIGNREISANASLPPGWDFMTEDKRDLYRRRLEAEFLETHVDYGHFLVKQ